MAIERQKFIQGPSCRSATFDHFDLSGFERQGGTQSHLTCLTSGYFEFPQIVIWQRLILLVGFFRKTMDDQIRWQTKRCIRRRCRSCRSGWIRRQILRGRCSLHLKFVGTCVRGYQFEPAPNSATVSRQATQLAPSKHDGIGFVRSNIFSTPYQTLGISFGLDGFCFQFEGLFEPTHTSMQHPGRKDHEYPAFYKQKAEH